MRITQKGQVTIPRSIREHFGLHPGQEVIFVEQGNQVILEKTQTHQVWKKYRGFLKNQKAKRTDDVIQKLRGLRP